MKEEDGEAHEKCKCARRERKRQGEENHAHYDETAEVEPEFACEVAEFISCLGGGRQKPEDRSHAAELEEIGANQQAKEERREVG